VFIFGFNNKKFTLGIQTYTVADKFSPQKYYTQLFLTVTMERVEVALHLVEIAISFNVSTPVSPSGNGDINGYFDIFYQNVRGLRAKSTEILIMCTLLILKISA
jgi:hypothetical protein